MKKTAATLWREVDESGFLPMLGLLVGATIFMRANKHLRKK